MYELLGALAFAALVAGYVLAVVFIRHQDEPGLGARRSRPPRQADVSGKVAGSLRAHSFRAVDAIVSSACGARITIPPR